MSNKGFKLYTYFLVAILFMAVSLTGTIIMMSSAFANKVLMKKIDEITSINSKVAKMIIEKRSALLLGSIKDLEYNFTIASDAFLEGDRKKLEEVMLSLYDQNFAQSMDLLIFVSADESYVFDASSPFYDTESIRRTLMREGRASGGRVRLFQAVSGKGTLLALASSTEAVSKTTGELAGTIYAGVVLNSNISLISEIASSVRLSEAAIVYGDQVISGVTNRPPKDIISICYNGSKIKFDDDKVSFCSHLDTENSDMPISFYQSFPENMVSSLKLRSKIVSFTAISIIIVVTIISGYFINALMVRSLYKLVDFTRAAMMGESDSFSPSPIREFNELGVQIASVSSELAETQAYLQNLIKHADAPIAVWDKKGTITLFNYSIEKLSGIKYSDIIGKHISHMYSIFPEVTVDTAGRDDSDVSSARFESVVRNKISGDVHFVFWSITDVYDDDKYYGTILQGMDITDRRSSEEKLLLASKVFENTLEAIFITDRKGIIMSVNKAFSSITGYDEDEALGKPHSIMNSDRHGEPFFKELWRSLRETGRWTGEIWNRRKNGEVYPAIQTISCIRDKKGQVTHFISVVHDITERKSYEEHIKYQATHDSLTGLVNRNRFSEIVKDSVESSRDRGELCAVAFMGLDRFKNLNDSLGHKIGDKVLQILSKRISDDSGSGNVVSRIGGDEYAIVMKGIKSRDFAIEKVQHIMSKMREPVSIQGYELFIQVSAGMAFYPDDSSKPDELMKNADVAMFQAKSTARNTLRLYSSELNSKMSQRLVMESKLNRAIENNELTLHYQPKIDITNMRVMGMEALLRWNNSELGSVSPEVFIPIAEDTGLILPIGEWVMRRAAEDTVKLHNMGFEELKIAVNLSLKQFFKRDFVEVVDSTFKSTGLSRVNFEFEITENVFSEDLGTISRIMEHMNEMEIKFAIDDFGTGYSSIGYLKKLPIHTLKIDKSYTNLIDTDRETETIVSSVILMAKSLGLSIVAEGAENLEQVKLLRGMGCDIVQGYYYSRPIPFDEFVDFVKSWDKDKSKV